MLDKLVWPAGRTFHSQIDKVIAQLFAWARRSLLVVANAAAAGCGGDQAKHKDDGSHFLSIRRFAMACTGAIEA